jgi:hypothetical protein
MVLVLDADFGLSGLPTHKLLMVFLPLFPLVTLIPDIIFDVSSTPKAYIRQPGTIFNGVVLVIGADFGLTRLPIHKLLIMFLPLFPLQH